MLLRPQKLFQPVHQLRYYVQRKVAELLVQQQPLLTTSFAPVLMRPQAAPVAALRRSPLANSLQRQFPMIKQACSPFTRVSQPAWRAGLRVAAYPTGSPLRIGAYRSFSSSPCQVFASYSPQPASVFSYVSSGMFSTVHAKHPAFPAAQPNEKTHLAVPLSKKDKKDKKKTMKKPLGYPFRQEKHTMKMPTAAATPVAPMAPIQSPSSLADIQTNDDTSLLMHNATVTKTTTRYFITLDFFPAALAPQFANADDKRVDTPIPWTRHTWLLLMAWKKDQDLYLKDLMHLLQRCLDQGYEIRWMTPVAASSSSSSLSTAMPFIPQLRLYFPSQMTRKEQALARLHALHDWISSPVRWELEDEQIQSVEQLLPLGPDYFQSLHLFLDQIDDMIHHGPAFAKV
ncbi:hypothetical protein BC940DRAFT_295893 [Gongronella butleri]|nr:hypothetical protein BC940DRAFT_295893 [Gongronella butleri]